MNTVNSERDSTRSTVDLGYAAVSYEKVGAGPNLLFVHGWPLNGLTWRNVVPHLEGFTRYVIDLPGCGHTTTTTKGTPFTVRAHAETLVRFIDELGFDQVTLVGQDSGGMACRFAAAQRPDVVDALVLAGSEVPGVHAPLVRIFKVLAHLPGARASFRLFMGNKFLARTPLILGGVVYDKTLLDGEMRTEMLGPILADDDAMDAAVEMIKGFSFDDIDALAEIHPTLKMPTLLAYGEDDGFFPVDKAEAMASQFGGSTEFVSIPNCKLLLHEEHPEKLADLMRAFLGRQLGEASA